MLERWRDSRETAPGQRYVRWWRDLHRDLVYAWRHLARTPGTSSLIVLTLAIGIGATVSMAGLIDRLLLKPPPHVVAPERVARLLFRAEGSAADGPVGEKWSYPAVLDLEREARAFDRVAAVATLSLFMGADASGDDLTVALVSPEFFPLFGAQPHLGRFFSSADGYPSDEASGGPPLAVLSFGFWQRAFAGEHAVLGRRVRIGDMTYTIVGVAPDGFRGAAVTAPDVWLPITVAAEADAAMPWRSGRAAHWVTAVGRIAPGVSPEQAAQQATTVWRHFNAPPRARGSETQVLAASIIPGRAPDAPRAVKVALWLGGASTLVLLIACANVANLLLARAFSRRREIAVRLALGASRGRLARQMLTEALLLAAIAGAAAVALAFQAGGLLQSLYGPLAGDGGAPVDLPLLLFAASVALGTGITVGLAPLLASLRTDLTEPLKATTGAGGGRGATARTLLLGVQAGACMVMLVVAGLFAQSLRRVEGLDLGVDVDHTVLVEFNLERVALSDADVAAIYSQFRQRVRGVPGVRRVALSSFNPFGGGIAVGPHTREHGDEYYWPPDSPSLRPAPVLAAVDSGFFRTMGATTLRGRDFYEGDVDGAPPVAIVNQPMVDFLWPGEDGLGRCVYLPEAGRNDECVTIVGVLPGFIKRGVLSRDAMAVYVPLAQTAGQVTRPGAMLVSLTRDAGVVLPMVRQAVRSVHQGIATPRIITVREMVDPAFRPWQTAAAMFGLFGAVALIVATIGLYAVVSYQVMQRSTEVAVRVALGASARHVLRAVAGEALRAVAIGLAAGVGTALLLRDRIGPLLFQTSASDPAIILGLSLLLLVVALMAAVAPTMSALRRGPAAVLRLE